MLWKTAVGWIASPKKARDDGPANVIARRLCDEAIQKGVDQFTRSRYNVRFCVLSNGRWM